MNTYLRQRQTAYLNVVYLNMNNSETITDYVSMEALPVMRCGWRQKIGIHTRATCNDNGTVS